MRQQDKKAEREMSNDFVERTGGYKTYDADLTELFELLDIKPLNKDALLLDAGCGTGKCSVALGKLGFRVIGVDISEKAIEIARGIAREHKVDVEFEVNDIETLPFDDSTFDFIFCGGVLHHFPELEKVSEELYRVLKVDGKLFAYEANKLNPVTYLLFTFASLSRKFMLLKYVQREFSVNERALGPKELEKILRRVGFTNFYFNSINIRNKDKDEHQIIQSKIRRLLNFLCEKFIPRLGRGRHLTLSCTKQ